jgi:[protein-PII] uridylyltransferase
VASPLSSPSAIREQFLADGDAAALLRRRSAGVDAIVTGAYEQYLAPQSASGLSLLAVGGYGREELFPHSDVDLLILVDRDVQGDAKRAALSAFLRSLWDAGLRLSQSVRTQAECCRFDAANVELSISLIDQRFLAGDQALHESLKPKLAKYFETQRVQLIKHLANLTQERHAKAQDTFFHLEPNIKENPGGIRDLHVIHWLGRLQDNAEDPGPRLDEARRFLFDIRCRLHYKYGRDANVLTFEAQEEFSDQPERWMREFYRHAREINRRALRRLELSEALIESSLLRQFRDWRSRLSNADFTVSRERVFFRAPQQISRDPELVLRLFAFVARHGMKLAIETMRRIEEQVPMLAEYFSVSRPVWAQLREILSLPHAPAALRAMHQTGVLLAVFPEWHEIECLVVRDFYHRYTVDEHTLEVIDAIASLRETALADRKRFANLLAESEPEIPILYLAMLFHDCGKSDGLESHALRSVRLAKVAFERIQVPQDVRELALFLIEHHLDLSVIMLSRDLNDPATMRELSQKVATMENLKLLTLVTYGDISGVNPGALTPWRMEQLWLTYLRGAKEFTLELGSDRIHTARDVGVDPSFLEGFPTRYLRTHNKEEIKDHSLLAERSRHAGVAIDLKRREGFWVLTVVTGDRPGLFASLAGTLSAFGMDIAKAEAFANSAGTVVDTFAFSDPMRTLELNPDEVDRLKLVVQRVVLGKEDVRKLLRGRSRPVSAKGLLKLKPTVAFDSDSSKLATLVEIVTEDRPGLLYDLASTLSNAGCNIEVVLIDTEAHKAIDVFYVTADGAKLNPELQASLRQELLQVCGNGG